MEYLIEGAVEHEIVAAMCPVTNHDICETCPPLGCSCVTRTIWDDPGRSEND